MNELGIGFFYPTPRSRIDLIRKDAHGHGDGDMFRGEKGELVFPVETGRRNPGVRKSGARRESNPRPSDSKCFRELSTALFSPSQGLTTDNEDSGIHEVNHSNPSNASQTLAAENKNFAALVLHDSELRAVSGGNALLTVREVAAILRVCRDTVYRLCAKGQLPHVRILNAIRIAPADLDCFLRVHRDCPKSLL